MIVAGSGVVKVWGGDELERLCYNRLLVHLHPIEVRMKHPKTPNRVQHHIVPDPNHPQRQQLTIIVKT